MLRRYSKARATANGSVSGGNPPDNARPTMDINEKRLLELSKSLEESENKINQVSSQISCLTINCRSHLLAYNYMTR